MNFFKKKKAEPIEDDDAKQAALENSEIIKELISEREDYIEKSEEIIEEHLMYNRTKEAGELAEDVANAESEIEVYRERLATYQSASISVRTPYADNRLNENDNLLTDYFGNKAAKEQNSDKYRGFVKKFTGYRQRSGIAGRVTRNMGAGIKRKTDAGQEVLARVQARLDSAKKSGGDLEKKIKDLKGVKQKS